MLLSVSMLEGLLSRSSFESFRVGLVILTKVRCMAKSASIGAHPSCLSSACGAKMTVNGRWDHPP